MGDHEMNAQQLLEHLYRGLSIGPDAPPNASAQEAPDPAPDCEIEQTAHCATRSAAGLSAEESTAAPMIATTKPTQPVLARSVATLRTRLSADPRIALALSATMVALIVAGAFYGYSTPDRPAPSSMATLQTPDRWLPSATPDEELEPVLVANPFDDAEVFEFPPGTSEDEARDAVAEMLMKRATERQAHLWR